MKNKRLFTRIDYDIKHEIYKIIELMGGKSDILSIIGSWKETQEDDEILAYLECHREILEERKLLKSI